MKLLRKHSQKAWPLYGFGSPYAVVAVGCSIIIVEQVLGTCINCGSATMEKQHFMFIAHLHEFFY